MYIIKAKLNIKIGTTKHLHTFFAKKIRREIANSNVFREILSKVLQFDFFFVPSRRFKYLI